MSACNIALWATTSDHEGGSTPLRNSLSLLRPNGPPPLPPLPRRRGFPPSISDVVLVALAGAACAAAPPLCLPLEAGRWSVSQVERIASLAVAIGIARRDLPRLTLAQDDAVCIAATRRLHHLLATARRSPTGQNLLARQFCQPPPQQGAP